MRRDEQEGGQADVPEDQADEPACKRGREAPETDPRENKRVHALEYCPCRSGCDA